MRRFFFWTFAALFVVSNLQVKKTVKAEPVEVRVEVVAPAHAIPSFLTRELMICESGDQDLGCHIDSNGKESCGPLQYQWDTWNAFSEQSGIKGSPLVRDDAIRMTNWALDRGLGPLHWVNCFEEHPEWKLL